MPAPRPLRLAPEWDDRFTRMTGVSAAAHVVAAAFLILAAERAGPRPLPLVAYTVEITDPSALGGRLPPGAPGKNFAGGTEAPPLHHRGQRITGNCERGTANGCYGRRAGEPRGRTTSNSATTGASRAPR